MKEVHPTSMWECCSSARGCPSYRVIQIDYHFFQIRFEHWREIAFPAMFFVETLRMIFPHRVCAAPFHMYHRRRESQELGETCDQYTAGCHSMFNRQLAKLGRRLHTGFSDQKGSGPLEEYGQMPIEICVLNLECSEICISRLWGSNMCVCSRVKPHVSVIENKISIGCWAHEENWSCWRSRALLQQCPGVVGHVTVTHGS